MYAHIKECLHNLSKHENDNFVLTSDKTRYYSGLVVGIVASLVDTGKTWEESCEIVRKALPNDCISLNLQDIVPNTWQDYIYNTLCIERIINHE